MSLSNATGGAGDLLREIIVCRDQDDLGRQAADAFVKSARQAVSFRGRFSAALSGGSTPRTLYQHLAEPPFSRRVPWDRVHLFWGDERAAPPDHPDSNYHMANETLIARVHIPPENVHRMPGERRDLDAAAAEYENVLRRFFEPTDDGWPAFDLVLLGIGSDGHTASLFPGSPVLEEGVRWVAAPYVEKLNAARLTLTLPALNHARQVLFLAAGKEKAPVLREILSDRPASPPLPARLIHPPDGRPIFFLDRAAADLIGKEKERR